MRKIFSTNLQLGIFIAAVIMTLLTSFLAYANSSVNAEWVNRDYEDYISSSDSYTVTSVPIKEFRTLNGTNDKSLTIADFYRVCLVDVTYAGGQTMKYYIPRSADDKVGDMVKVAYEKHWDTEYDKVMKGSNVEPDSILHTARAERVTDGFYARIFCTMAVVSGVFSALVFFICYKKKNAYEL